MNTSTRNTLNDAAIATGYGQQTPASPRFWEMAHTLDKMDESERIQSIKNGFAIDWAEAAKQVFHLPTQNMTELLNLSSATYERRRKDAKPLNAAASERLERIASVALLAAKVFEDEMAASEMDGSSQPDAVWQHTGHALRNRHWYTSSAPDIERA